MLKAMPEDQLAALREKFLAAQLNSDKRKAAAPPPPPPTAAPAPAPPPAEPDEDPKAKVEDTSRVGWQAKWSAPKKAPSSFAAFAAARREAGGKKG